MSRDERNCVATNIDGRNVAVLDSHFQGFAYVAIASKRTGGFLFCPGEVTTGATNDYKC